MSITRTQQWLLFIVLVVIAIVVNLPILSTIVNSLRTTDNLLSSRTFDVSDLTLQNYAYVSGRTRFWAFFGNSIFVSVSAACLGVIVASLAGYAMSRYQGLVVTSYSRLLLLIQMFPLILAIIPLFILFRNLSLINSPLSVILIYTVANLSFATWMFKSFFDSIPRELEEAAAVDGCSKVQGLVRVVLPLAGPGTAAVAIFAFLLAFNEFFIANVFLRDEARLTLPVGIQIFTQQYGSDWGSLMAAATLTMLPTFCLFLFIQKYMLYGSIGAGVKG
jgi:ABC-type glycerol-3-phosphate transport system permease component